MSIEDIRVFHGDDKAYQDWVDRNGGYVLTVRDAGGYMLHDSECGHLGRDGDLSLQLTKKQRRWAKSRHDLAAWVRQENGTDPLLCRSCM